MASSPLASAILFHLGPVAITRPVVTTWVIIAVLALGSWVVTRRLALHPDRRQATLELIVTGIISQIEEVIRKDARPFLPILGTLFIFLVAAIYPVYYRAWKRRLESWKLRPRSP
jgi:F-type H+-transporting ATPase subunit a